MSSPDDGFDVLKSIKAHIDLITPVLPSQVVVTVGQYALGTLDDSDGFIGDDTPTLLRILHKKETSFKTVDLYPEKTIIIDTVYEPHYWFDLHSHLQGDTWFSEELANRIYSYHDEVLSVLNLSEGIASGVLPALYTHIASEDISALSLGVFPSMGHSSDALFNAFACLGLLTIDASAPLLIMDQSKLEDFTGVHREGEILAGKEVIDYLVKLFMEKKGFIRDLVKLSRSFNVGLYTILMAAGCSLGIYETFRNILDITLEQPLLDIDLSTADMLYVVVKIPLSLRDEYSKGRVELEVSGWVKDHVNIDAPQICEPIYVEEFGDRIDVAILVGGFDTTELFDALDKRIQNFSKMMVEQDLYDDVVWLEIRKRLLKR